MTNDILEQVAEDYLREKGYFTMHNVSYRPKTWKQTPSDIDIIAINPHESGVKRVAVLSCKSWQSGLKIQTLLKDLRENPTKVIQGKERQKLFREIADPLWSQAVIEKVQELTNQSIFTFYIIATHVIGDKNEWREFEMFKKNLPNCMIELIDLKSMIDEILLLKRDTKMPVHSELGRLLQLIEAGKGRIVWNN